MILLALFVVGAITAVTVALNGPFNGLSLLGLLLMLPAIWRGIFHDLYLYIPAFRRKAQT